MGLNDAAWAVLAERHHIQQQVQEEGYCTLSAAAIKREREPRLMTKFDHQVNLPALFAANGLSILPISRGDYMISTFAAYQAFPEPLTESRRVTVPAHLESLSPQFLHSESIALNFAHACGMLADFLEDESLVPTVSGRMGSGVFDFSINTRAGPRDLTVQNAQIEIDAAYEGTHSLVLFEAKKDLADDFLIRQLYYPFRTWQARVRKPVQTVFLTFSNGVFSLYGYGFEDPGHYNSLRLTRQRHYHIATDITLDDLAELLRHTEVLPEPELPFPQADSLPRLINLLELLDERPMRRDEITAAYAFDARQTNYYTDAGRYLGLLEKHKEGQAIAYRLSSRGQQLMRLEHRTRQMTIAAAILQHRAFHEVLRRYLMTSAWPDRGAIVDIMRESGLYQVTSENTYGRRASTIRGWLLWIVALAEPALLFPLSR